MTLVDVNRQTRPPTEMYRDGGNVGGGEWCRGVKGGPFNWSNKFFYFSILSGISMRIFAFWNAREG